MLNFNKKVGFTLAEVLVTLGLLGVISAITIPNLAFNYRGKVLEEQFMSTYSDIKQAAVKLNDNHGGDWASYATGAGSNKWYDEFMAQFNGGNMYRAENKDWSVFADNLAAAYPKSSGRPYRYFTLSKTWTHAGACDNGGVWTDSKGRIWTFNSENAMICVDINGPARPNRLNIDNFIFIPMTSEMLSIWVYDETDNKGDYTGTIIPCDYEKLMAEGLGNKVPSKHTSNADNIKEFKKGSGSALDACPFYWPVTNAWPVDSDGKYLPSARGIQPRSGSATTYWKDYIEYR